ncbi:MAG: TolC family protein [Bryobacteraceae bacterium]
MHRWRFRGRLLILSTLTALILGAQDLTLEQALDMALKSNRGIQNSAIEAGKFDDRKASVKSQFLPSAHVFAIGAQPVAPFDFRINQGTLGTDSLGGPIPDANVNLRTPAHPIGLASVNVIQPLSAIPTIRKELGLIDLQKKLVDEQTRLERQNLVRDVRQLYYGIQNVESSLRAARESVRLAQEVVRVTSEYVEKRQVLDVDYLEAQLHLAKAMESVLDLENQRASLKAKLNFKLGREVLTDFTVPEIPAVADGNLPDSLQSPAEVRDRAVAQRPEIRQAGLRIEEAKAELRIASAGFNPTIAAQFTAIKITDVNALLPRQIGIAGVSLTWEPFTWGRKQHDLAVHRAKVQQAMNNERDAKSRVEIDVADQYRRLQLAAARLHVASLGLQMATESLRLAKKQYEVQFTLLKTVLQSQTALENANADYQRSLGGLWTARAEYERALGQDQ